MHAGRHMSTACQHPLLSLTHPRSLSTDWRTNMFLDVHWSPKVNQCIITRRREAVYVHRYNTTDSCLPTPFRGRLQQTRRMFPLLPRRPLLEAGAASAGGNVHVQSLDAAAYDKELADKRLHKKTRTVYEGTLKRLGVTLRETMGLPEEVDAVSGQPIVPMNKVRLVQALALKPTTTPTAKR